MSDHCTSCGGDGIKKPIEHLKTHKEAVKRCLACRGTGLVRREPRPCRTTPWYSIRFKTSDGDMIRITTRGTDERDARLKARRLLDPSIHCEML